MTSMSTSPYLLLDCGLGVIIEKDGKRRLSKLKTMAPMESGDNIWSKYFNVRDIPQEYLTPEMTVDRFKQEYLSLETIPYEMRTTEVCLYAVSRIGYGHDIRFVPDHIITQEMCNAAAGLCDVINLVPSRFININFLIASCIPSGSAFHTMLKKGLLTYRVCLEAVKKCGALLEHVPKRMKSYEICLAAVRNHGHAYKFTPRPLRDFYLALTAVKNDGHSIIWVKREWRSDDLVMLALLDDPLALVGLSNKKYWMYLLAASGRGRVLLYTPPYWITDELIMAAVSDNGSVLEFVAPWRRTRRVCIAAVTNFGPAYDHVPDDIRDGEIRMLALGAKHYPYLGILDEHFTPDMYNAIINNAVVIRRINISFIPSAWQHFTTYAKMLHADPSKMSDIPTDTPGYYVLCKILAYQGWSITYVPYEHLTVELCLIALKRDVRNIDVIDERYDIITKLICMYRMSQIGVMKLLTCQNVDGEYMPAEILANVIRYL